MFRDILRNIALAYLPPKISFNINIWKNIKLSYLEAEMPYIQEILGAIKNMGKEPTAVDIGANLGLFSYLMSRYSQKVIAIEPQPKLARYLTQVLPKNVSILNLAVSDHDGIAQMLIPKVKGLIGSSAQQDALATIEAANPITNQVDTDHIDVPIKTLDEILAKYPQIDFIKIDVEGHELAVLNGAKNILRKIKPIFMIELYKAHNPSVIDCIKLFFGFEFTCFYCTSSGIVECPTIKDVSSIIDTPKVDDRVITNFFFVPIEKKDFVLSLFNNKKY